MTQKVEIKMKKEKEKKNFQAKVYSYLFNIQNTQKMNWRELIIIEEV